MVAIVLYNLGPKQKDKIFGFVPHNIQFGPGESYHGAQMIRYFKGKGKDLESKREREKEDDRNGKKRR